MPIRAKRETMFKSHPLARKDHKYDKFIESCNEFYHSLSILAQKLGMFRALDNPEENSTPSTKVGTLFLKMQLLLLMEDYNTSADVACEIGTILGIESQLMTLVHSIIKKELQFRNLGAWFEKIGLTHEHSKSLSSVFCLSSSSESNRNLSGKWICQKLAIERVDEFCALTDLLNGYQITPSIYTFAERLYLQEELLQGCLTAVSNDSNAFMGRYLTRLMEILGLENQKLAVELVRLSVGDKTIVVDLARTYPKLELKDVETANIMIVLLTTKSPMDYRSALFAMSLKIWEYTGIVLFYFVKIQIGL